MATPQITLRVPGVKLKNWKAACASEGTNVSEQIRALMDEWAAQTSGDRPSTA